LIDNQRIVFLFFICFDMFSSQENSTFDRLLARASAFVTN
jgi:hypothetical protein